MDEERYVEYEPRNDESGRMKPRHERKKESEEGEKEKKKRKKAISTCLQSSFTLLLLLPAAARPLHRRQRTSMRSKYHELTPSFFLSDYFEINAEGFKRVKKYVQQTSLMRHSSVIGRQGVLFDSFPSMKPRERSESAGCARAGSRRTMIVKWTEEQVGQRRGNYGVNLEILKLLIKVFKQTTFNLILSNL